jgi:hypothetical protein
MVLVVMGGQMRNICAIILQKDYGPLFLINNHKKPGITNPNMIPEIMDM